MAQPDPTAARRAVEALRENKAVQVRRSPSEPWVKSRVEAVLGRHLQVGHPMAGGRLLKIRKGDRVEIGFDHAGEFYVFAAPVLHDAHRPVPLFTVFRPDPRDLIRQDRRDSERAYALVPLAYEVQGPGLSGSASQGMALNLSPTGLAFNAPAPLSKGAVLAMEIHLPTSSASVSARGEVVSCVRVPQSREERWKVRVKFNRLGKTGADRIREFVRRRREFHESMGY